MFALAEEGNQEGEEQEEKVDEDDAEEDEEEVLHAHRPVKDKTP